LARDLIDLEGDRLAMQGAARHSIGKAEDVRRALLNESECDEAAECLVECAMAFTDALLARSRPHDGQPADKAFIDGLYE